MKKEKKTPAVEAETSTMDKYVEALFQVLPCSSYQEIADKMSAHLGSEKSLTTADVGVVLSHLRGHSDEYQWTVPHVRRGKPDESDEGRYFAALVDANGDIEPLTVAERWHMKRGANGTMQSAITQRANEMAAIRALTPALPANVARYARRLTKGLMEVGKAEEGLLALLTMLEPEEEAA